MTARKYRRRPAHLGVEILESRIALTSSASLSPQVYGPLPAPVDSPPIVAVLAPPALATVDSVQRAAAPAKADLTATSLDYRVAMDVTGRSSGPLPVNSRFTATVSVRNGGATNAGSFYVSFYLVKDNTDATYQQYLGRTTVASLRAGASTTVTRELSLPSNLSLNFFGSVKLLVFVDSSSAISESNESNNQRSRQVELFDPVPQRVDLPMSFATVANARAWLRSNRFDGEVRGDYGWSRSLSSSTFSRFNGQWMPANAFRIQAGIRGTGPAVINLQGAERTFNPANSPTVFGEPNPRTALEYGLTWSYYVYRFHQRF